MPGAARVGDILGPGGVLTAPFSPDVFVNGRPVALFACVYTPHLVVELKVVHLHIVVALLLVFQQL